MAPLSMELGSQQDLRFRRRRPSISSTFITTQIILGTQETRSGDQLCPKTVLLTPASPVSLIIRGMTWRPSQSPNGTIRTLGDPPSDASLTHVTTSMVYPDQPTSENGVYVAREEMMDDFFKTNTVY